MMLPSMRELKFRPLTVQLPLPLVGAVPVTIWLALSLIVRLMVLLGSAVPETEKDDWLPLSIVGGCAIDGVPGVTVSLLPVAVPVLKMVVTRSVALTL